MSTNNPLICPNCVAGVSCKKHKVEYYDAQWTGAKNPSTNEEVSSGHLDTTEVVTLDDNTAFVKALAVKADFDANPHPKGKTLDQFISEHPGIDELADPLGERVEAILAVVWSDGFNEPERSPFVAIEEGRAAILALVRAEVIRELEALHRAHGRQADNATDEAIDERLLALEEDKQV